MINLILRSKLVIIILNDELEKQDLKNKSLHRCFFDYQVKKKNNHIFLNPNEAA